MEQCSGHDISQAINPPAHRAGHGLPEWLAGLDPPGAHRSVGRKGRYPVRWELRLPLGSAGEPEAWPEPFMASRERLSPKPLPLDGQRRLRSVPCQAAARLASGSVATSRLPSLTSFVIPVDDLKTDPAPPVVSGLRS